VSSLFALAKMATLFPKNDHAISFISYEIEGLLRKSDDLL